MVIYWYRQSPGYLGGFDLFRDAWVNPPPIVSGMTGVRLDTRGRLLEFYTVPPEVDPAPAQFQVQSSSARFRVPSFGFRSGTGLKFQLSRPRFFNASEPETRNLNSKPLPKLETRNFPWSSSLPVRRPGHQQLQANDISMGSALYKRCSRGLGWCLSGATGNSDSY